MDGAAKATLGKMTYAEAVVIATERDEALVQVGVANALIFLSLRTLSLSLSLSLSRILSACTFPDACFVSTPHSSVTVCPSLSRRVCIAQQVGGARGGTLVFKLMTHAEVESAAREREAKTQAAAEEKRRAKLEAIAQAKADEKITKEVKMTALAGSSAINSNPCM